LVIMPRPLLLVLTATLAGCGGGGPTAPPVTPGFPTLVFTDPEPPSILEAPAAQMPEALRAFYRLKPDVRFLGAIAEVHRLVSGEPADTVKVSWRDGRWAIAYRGEQVGDLPDLPGFDDATALLDTWAMRLVVRYPLATTGAPTTEERESVLALLERLDAPQLGAALQTVDAGWRRNHHPGWLPLAASALTLLAIQLPKTDVVGDPLVARSLAAAALAGAAGYADTVAQIRTLLGEQMGYTHEAVGLAKALLPDHPVRLLVTRDRTGLRDAVAGERSTPLSRFLYLRAVADQGDSHDFTVALVALGRTPSSGALGAAVTASHFETDALVMDLVPRTLTAEMAVVSPGSGPLGRVAHLLEVIVRRLLGHEPQSRGVWDGGALVDFEGRVGALKTQFAGPFLTGDLYGLYFRAQLHAAFERACIHYVDGLSSADGATRFVDAFAAAPPGLWADAVRWCRSRVEVLAGQGSADNLLEAVRTVRELSEPALQHSLSDVADLLHYADERHVAAARIVFSRLDARPQALRRASQVATDELGDVPLAERLDQRLLGLAAEDYPELAVWSAQYHRDAQALSAQARDPRLTLEARYDALEDLLPIRADTTATFAAVERLLADAPDDWRERRRYVEQLEHAGRFTDAARVARAWLATHGPERGFDYLFATTALARQYQHLGQLDQAYALLEPLQASYQLGVLQRSALIALARGDVARAERLAQRVVDRYPESADARVTLAEVRWAQHRYEDGPALLHDPNHVLSYDDWRHTVGPRFASLFGRQPVAEGEGAFAALAEGGVPATLLAALPPAAAESGFAVLAFTLQQRLVPPPGGDDAAAVDFYRYVVAARGAAAGRAWLSARWSPVEARRQSLSIYRNGLYDLLWNLNAVPDDGADGSYFWLLRTLAWLQDPKRDAARRAQLIEFYRRPDARFYHIAGRCLLGLEPEEDLLIFATTPHRRAEVSYYVGIKALSERRYSTASDWLRVTVETHSAHDWELLWARDLLTRWAGAGRELEVAVPQVAAKPPTW